MSLRILLAACCLLPSIAFAQACAPEHLAQVTIQTTTFPSLPGQNVGITVFLDPVSNPAVPTGQVRLYADAADLGTFTLRLPQISTSRTFFESGAHILRAYYDGDYVYCPVMGVFGQEVEHLTPTVTLTSSASAAPYGTPVTLTAQIAPAPPAGVAAPLGPVQFLEGSTVLGLAAPANGKASVTLTKLAPGTHQIVAMLTGDIVWYSVRSLPLAQTVQQAATATTLTVSSGVSSATLSAVVAATATVAGSVPPDGTVQFLDSISKAVLGSAAAPSASVTIPAARIAASVGHAITAVYSGSAGFAPSTSAPIGIPVAAGATGAVSANLAPEEIASLYGWNLADATQQAGATPLPTSLAGYAITVKDSAGTERAAGLYLVSPGQFNFVIPPATAPGIALLTVTGPGGAPRAQVAPIRVNVAPVAPGIFTTTSDGKGTPAAQLIRVRPDGSQAAETLTPAGFRIGTDTVYLVLYGSGIRNRSSLAAVVCTVGGQAAPVAYAGAQSQSPGLDQVNVLLPAALAGAGDVILTLTVDGQPANAVTLKIIG